MNLESESHEIEFWKVAVEAPLPQALTYRVPPLLRADSTFMRGQCVVVPLGRRKVSGVLLGPSIDTGEYKLRDVLDIDKNRPCVPENFVLWLEWLARYYVHPIGQVAEMVFPPLLRSTKTRKSKRAPVIPQLTPSVAPVLTAEQSKVIKDIEASPGFQVHLVHGVTGSGKTEIYMQLLETVLKAGKQGLILVPEISLTPQLIDRFSARFGNAISVIHSHLTPREKTNQWWAMMDGEKQILIGARSALFCPLKNLGMIVIDEEHESSFKQDEKLKYNARDAAVMLAKFVGCPVILGSATPSLESWHNAQAGRYRLHQLKSRVADRRMPTIEVVDMREERDQRKQAGVSTLPFWIGQSLFTAIGETLKKGQQAALFLNRRGVAQAVVCPSCGWVPACPNCAVKLTLHGKSHLLCHYCDYHETMTEYCGECRTGEPKPIGLGTEMIENDLAKLFPAARIARMDRDEINTREDLERVIHAVENREIDLLVGTQMIAKGLDFAGLTLVGMVMADVAFNLPDFRASERSFQLLTQVSGRSGRHLDEGAGRVFIQTYNPDHPSIQFTCAHDFEGFARFELGFREALSYPPFWRLACMRIQGLDLEKVIHSARGLKSQALGLQARLPAFAKIEILGPAEAPLAKLRNQHRWQLLLKGPDSAALGAFCRTLCENQDWLPTAVKISVDIDAVHML
jgi:primosomal protein N' (replication factor Y)